MSTSLGTDSPPPSAPRAAHLLSSVGPENIDSVNEERSMLFCSCGTRSPLHPEIANAFLSCSIKPVGETVGIALPSRSGIHSENAARIQGVCCAALRRTLIRAAAQAAAAGAKAAAIQIIQQRGEASNTMPVTIPIRR